MPPLEKPQMNLLKKVDMSTLPSNTPIIVGVGQFTERLDSPGYRALSACDIAAEASRRAFADALSMDRLGPAVDAIATTRTFEDSTPARAQPSGKSNNFPRSIAHRLGIQPELAVWEKAGGNSPQQLVSEFFERVASGEVAMALVTGAENMSSARALKAAGKMADWAETVDGAVEDRGLGLKGLVTRYNAMHKVLGAPVGYALSENARRSRLGLTRRAYALEMGRLFAPFTKVAAANPLSSSEQCAMTAEELITPSERNRLIADPYPQRARPGQSRRCGADHQRRPGARTRYSGGQVGVPARLRRLAGARADGAAGSVALARSRHGEPVCTGQRRGPGRCH